MKVMLVNGKPAQGGEQPNRALEEVARTLEAEGNRGGDLLDRARGPWAVCVACGRLRQARPLRVSMTW